jgi:uncharacterized phage protein (TIGR02216 family)
MTPWRAWMAFGLGRLGLSPREFWTMSLAEWRAVLAAQEPYALGRRELEDLMLEHPDVSDRP